MTPVLTAVAVLTLTPGAPDESGLSLDRLDNYVQQVKLRRKSCGPTAVWFCLYYFGIPTDRDALCREANLGPEGTSLKALVDLGESHGLHPEAIRVPTKELETLPIPSILVADGTHCVVYLGVNPETGDVCYYESSMNRMLSAERDLVERSWNGEAIVFREPSVSSFAFALITAVSAVLVFVVGLRCNKSIGSRRKTAVQLEVSTQPVEIRRDGYSLPEVLLVIAIIGILIGLTLGAVQQARAAAAREQCQNRLRQIGLACHQYHNTFARLPTGCSNSSDPQPFMSWLTRLLPYLEQESTWQQSLLAYQQDSFFETSPHIPILGRLMPLFTCPMDTRAAVVQNWGPFQTAYTSYQGVSGTTSAVFDGVFYLNSNTAFATISDGLSNTLAVGERPPSLDGTFGWWYAGWGQQKTGSGDSVLGVREMYELLDRYSCAAGPYEYTAAGIPSDCDFLRFWSFHAGGANFLLVDGAIRFLRYDANPILPALATRAGNEVFTVPD